MKTFSEAVLVLSKSGGCDYQTHCREISHLLIEVKNNDDAQEMLGVVVTDQMVSAGMPPIKVKHITDELMDWMLGVASEVAVLAFVRGLRVGVEMEKQELKP